MEYSVKELADLAGITPRTLRYYDRIGLLVPKRGGSGDYRLYGHHEVDRLQEILIYRQLDIELAEIKDMIDGSAHNRKTRLEKHLDHIIKKRDDMNILIDNVKRTIKSEKGEIEMSDEKKFEGIKKDMIEANEVEFGEEARNKWGDQMIDESNRKMMKMTKTDFEDMKNMAEEINKRLEKAVTDNISIHSKEAMEIAELHKKWLRYTWPDYDPDAHLGLVEMYLVDERFRKYYDSNIKGCARFLRDAVVYMISEA